MAARLAAGLGARVTQLSVVPPPGEGRECPLRGDLLPPVDLEELHAAEALRVHAAAFPGSSVERVVLVGRDPAEEIIAYLRGHPVDSIVMATHGRSGLRQLVAGSVTDAVVRSGLAPVVAVGPPAVGEAAESRHASVLA